jgi:hypothetical protein
MDVVLARAADRSMVRPFPDQATVETMDVTLTGRAVARPRRPIVVAAVVQPVAVLLMIAVQEDHQTRVIAPMSRSPGGAYLIARHQFRLMKGVLSVMQYQCRLQNEDSRTDRGQQTEKASRFSHPNRFERMSETITLPINQWSDRLPELKLLENEKSACRLSVSLHRNELVKVRRKSS